MHTIKIYVQGSGRFTETVQDDPGATALAVESLVSQVLLELFEIVTVQDIVVEYTPSPSEYKPV
ncbi:MAG TPA: hypothetical protein VKR06_16395 [Ktedonosporobacter sp.]|nr:hypothetical protein [Ktedonosporobacter sp.]